MKSLRLLARLRGQIQKVCRKMESCLPLTVCGFFESVKGEVLCAELVKVWNFAVFKDIREHQWQCYLDGQMMARLRWGVLYELRLRSGDQLWKVLHGTLATNEFRSKLDHKMTPGYGGSVNCRVN